MAGLPPETLALFAVALIVPILPNLWSIWHIFRSDFATAQEKMAWLGAAVFIPFLGGLAYVCIGRKRAKRVI